ncbi:MAG: hypothetical protein GY754_08315 [bacterium]|nr:hypothetical protein [bacterium]
MSMNELQTVSLRHQAVYIPESLLQSNPGPVSGAASILAANLAKLGFGVSEALLYALNRTTPAFREKLLEQFRQVMGVEKNWAPLVKGWDVPTGETLTHHIITFYANVFNTEGTTLPCGHTIPKNTFPLERYNGCSFCGTPFEFGKIENYGQGSKLKILELWHEPDVFQCFTDLLTSRTALDATQIESLKLLLTDLPLPEVEICMKETLMVVLDLFVEQGRAEDLRNQFKTPNDILRYLWYKHTGFLQIVDPKTIIKRKKSNARAVYLDVSLEQIKDEMTRARQASKDELKLKYGRKDCRLAAGWLNSMDMSVEQMCEIMHPKRGMWVRFIRALRLAEYSKREGFEHLKKLLDLFYTEKYTVWQGELEKYRKNADIKNTVNRLKQRPGIFARTLFTNMLRLGTGEVIPAFFDIIDHVPARLLFTLSMYAENYFTHGGNRTVKALGGISKNIPYNKLLKLYTKGELEEMKQDIENLCLLAMKNRFARIGTGSKSIYIDPMLFKMPVPIGDRSESVQDLPSVLMGTRFAVEGSRVRLFMQWGEGLPAQPLDMDLSCFITYKKHSDIYSFGSLVIPGCKHSGDIRRIPHNVGTAEYIDINIKKLQKREAGYAVFTCNSYSSGEITPNLVVGWMESKHPMKISKKTGVAYDPSCVQHQVRITRGLTKGLAFGVLEIESGEIIWLEMPFYGQVAQNLDTEAVESLLKKLDSKLNIGNLLLIKAEAQGLTIMETPDADEVYDQQWAINAAAVTQLLVD